MTDLFLEPVLRSSRLCAARRSPCDMPHLVPAHASRMLVVACQSDGMPDSRLLTWALFTSPGKNAMPLFSDGKFEHLALAFVNVSIAAPRSGWRSGTQWDWLLDSRWDWLDSR